MIWKSFGSESKGVSFRKEIPAVWIHVSEALVDQLHSLDSVVEDASLVLTVEAVSDHLQRSVVLVERAHANLFFWFYTFLFEKIIEK